MGKPATKVKTAAPAAAALAHANAHAGFAAVAVHKIVHGGGKHVQPKTLFFLDSEVDYDDLLAKGAIRKPTAEEKAAAKLLAGDAPEVETVAAVVETPVVEAAAVVETAAVVEPAAVADATTPVAEASADAALG